MGKLGIISTFNPNQRLFLSKTTLNFELTFVKNHEIRGSLNTHIMGRAFEFRKARKMKRWGKMAVTFTRIGKEIAMAVKQGGPDPENNPRLRVAVQNAKAENMPKDRVEAAIQRASNKDSKDYQEVVYEGKGPYNVSIIIETATDNPTRTVANIRVPFNRNNGELIKTGSLDYIFDRKCIFKIDPAGQNLEDLELQLIDYGLEEIEQVEDETLVYTAFTDFGNMQKGLEEQGITIISVDKERIPNMFVELTPEQLEEVNKLIDRLEEDEDVQNVFHNIKS
jgi:YebC/PmpR family DNA-binding regulatory protein